MMTITLANSARSKKVIFCDAEYYTKYFENLTGECLTANSAKPLNNRFLIPNIEKTGFPSISGFRELATINQLLSQSPNGEISKIQGQSHGNRGFIINFQTPSFEEGNFAIWNYLHETMLSFGVETLDMYIDYPDSDMGLYTKVVIDPATSLESGVIALQDQNEGLFFTYNGIYPNHEFNFIETIEQFVNEIDHVAFNSSKQTRIGVTLSGGTLSNAELKNNKNGNRFLLDGPQAGPITIDSYSNSAWLGDFYNQNTILNIGTDYRGGWIRMSQANQKIFLKNDTYPINVTFTEIETVRVIR